VRPITNNKKHLVTEIGITLSGAVNESEADSLSTYRLTTAGKHGSFTAKHAKVIPLKSALYNPATHTVTLTPAKAFKLSKKLVELGGGGVPPPGLQDSLGRFINGGNNAVAVLGRGGAPIPAVRHSPTDTRRFRPELSLRRLTPAAVDALLERIDA